MYAIVEIGGKQYKVEKNDEILVDLMDVKEGAKVSYETVTLYRDDKEIVVGQPYCDKVKLGSSGCQSFGEGRKGDRVQVSMQSQIQKKKPVIVKNTHVLR